MIIWSENQMPKSSEGYGYAPDSLYHYIEKSGLPIRRKQPKNWVEIQQLKINLPIGYFDMDKAQDEIVVNCSVPDAFIKSKIYSVGFTFWETNRLPRSWVDFCNQMDEVWTCSEFMQKSFIESGITKPVYEFKLGVDPKLYFPIKRSPHSQFTFLSIGSPATRKNSQLALDAFLKVFGNNENYRLIYKSNGPPDARIRLGDEINTIIHPRITVIDEEYSHSDLAKLYDQADCLLYPTSGEGWGLIPFQAIAKGIPTICTNALACTEFANMSVPLDFRWDSNSMFGIYTGAGEWAKPNFDDLCDKMKYVVENYELISDKTYENARFINKNMTWQKVSQKYISRLEWILKNKGGIK